MILNNIILNQANFPKSLALSTDINIDNLTTINVYYLIIKKVRFLGLLPFVNKEK